MPRPPGIIDRVNFVIDTWNNPCDAPWAVYMEVAKPVVLGMFVEIICFGFLDVVRFIFRPAGVRSGRHMRSKKKGQHGRKKQGLGNRIRSKIPPLAALANRQVTQGVKTLWVIDGIGQRLLWWWLVADVVSGGLYNFTSLLYKTEECQMSGGPGAALMEGAAGVHGAIQGWTTVGYTDFQYQRGTASIGPFAFATGPGFWSVAASVETEAVGDVGATVEMRIVLNRALGQEFEGLTQAELKGQGTAGIVTTATFHGGLTGWVQIKVSQGFVNVIGGTLFVLGRPAIPPPPVKFDCFGLAP